MTICKFKSSSQLTIFEFLQRLEARASQAADAPAQGSLNIAVELRAALAEDLKHAVDPTGRELSRYVVAARMSELLGHEITKAQVDNYTAAHAHRFPCEFLPAFILATGGQRRTAEVLSKHSGLFLLPGPEALRAEIQRLEEEIKKKKTEKSKREIFLRELEGAHGR